MNTRRLGKEMNDMYQKIKGDTLLTEVQRDSLMEVLDKKETEGMDRIYQLVSEILQVLQVYTC